MTPPSRDQYADRLIAHAMRLVACVHDDGRDAVLAALADLRALPAPADVDPATALAVTLAAMVDPGRNATELLAWTLFFLDLRDPQRRTDALKRAHAAYSRGGRTGWMVDGERIYQRDRQRRRRSTAPHEKGAA